VNTISPDVLATIVDRLAMAVLVFRSNRLIYTNVAATTLADRLRSSYRIELDVMLRDHVRAVVEHQDDEGGARQPIVTLLTATNGEPFYVYVTPLGNASGDIAVSVRALGAEIDAFRRRYRLSVREAQVAELVLHGYKNTDIAAALGITAATTKKHLTKIFDKVGVDTRSQLQTRLA
jgi:DNA-binding CsgD family transcriptional regulator